jgi:moderate conductance mechanosensitive channel
MNTSNRKVLYEYINNVLHNGIVISMFKTIVIIALTIFAVKVGSFAIKKFFQKQKSFRFGIDSKKIDTVSTLLVSIYKYTIYLIAIVMILSDIFELKSVLATAGIGGIVVGLGAQSFIKDIISGFFILLEDQFVVGDLITLDSMTGTVEQIELRLTRIRNANGDLHVVPNGEIKKVTNHTRGNKAVIVDIPIDYNLDLSKVFNAVGNVCSMVSTEFESIVEEPKLLGITELGRDSMNLRIMAMALPNDQPVIERRIRKLIWDEFQRQNIEFSIKSRIIVEDAARRGETNG